MKLFSKTLLAIALCSMTNAYAQSIAITNATLHTASDEGVLTQASLVMDDGKIIAINPAKIDADVVIDAKGAIVTPGLIGSLNQLGLVEVGAVASSRDGRDKDADISFNGETAFNPKSSVVAYSRKGGITRDVIMTSGGSLFLGQASLVELTGEFNSVITPTSAVVMEFGAQKKGSRALKLQQLVDELTEHQQQSSEKPPKKKQAPLSNKAKLLNQLLAGTLPLIIKTDRAQDILHLIKLKQQFNLDISIAGGAEAWRVAPQLAEADIAVILSPLQNLPGNFDSLHASMENASRLDKTGVQIAFTVVGDATHNLYQLRFDAGNAIANGLNPASALKAVTYNVADIFNIDAGQLAVDKAADVVIWSGDPFELSTHVERIFIGGKEYSTQSRHDKLRQRYTTDSQMPRAYTK
ncbi:amidohydrolase family protein [Shewanella marina]|uniref:amidohydrolase family protein n=1 Tax=Shewanella marina TaxID=487319 RepID=UPI0004712200|nr:amidohydrolase family protein [Shewanella marina]